MSVFYTKREINEMFQKMFNDAFSYEEIFKKWMQKEGYKEIQDPESGAWVYIRVVKDENINGK
jgi:hypothetical protein